MNQPTILLWNVPVLCPAHTALTTHPENKNISFQHIAPEHTGRTLATLAGLSSGKDVPALPCASTPAIIFCGLSDEQLDNCLALLRGCGQQVPLKAILTIHNQNWTFGKLFQELESEYQYFQSHKKPK